MRLAEQAQRRQPQILPRLALIEPHAAGHGGPDGKVAGGELHTQERPGIDRHVEPHPPSTVLALHAGAPGVTQIGLEAVARLQKGRFHPRRRSQRQPQRREQVVEGHALHAVAGDAVVVEAEVAHPPGGDPVALSDRTGQRGVAKEAPQAGGAGRAIRPPIARRQVDDAGERVTVLDRESPRLDLHRVDQVPVERPRAAGAAAEMVRIGKRLPVQEHLRVGGIAPADAHLGLEVVLRRDPRPARQRPERVLERRRPGLQGAAAETGAGQVGAFPLSLAAHDDPLRVRRLHGGIDADVAPGRHRDLREAPFPEILGGDRQSIDSRRNILEQVLSGVAGQRDAGRAIAPLRLQRHAGGWDGRARSPRRHSPADASPETLRQHGGRDQDEQDRRGACHQAVRRSERVPVPAPSGHAPPLLATDQPALTNRLLVTPDSVALPANQSVNVNQIGGAAVTEGQKTMAASVPVALASDQTTLPAVAEIRAATLHVTGTAALYLSTHTSATPSQVEAQMKLDNGGLSKNSKDGSGDRIVYAGRY